MIFSYNNSAINCLARIVIFLSLFIIPVICSSNFFDILMRYFSGKNENLEFSMNYTWTTIISIFLLINLIFPHLYFLIFYILIFPISLIFDSGSYFVSELSLFRNIFSLEYEQPEYKEQNLSIRDNTIVFNVFFICINSLFLMFGVFFEPIVSE
jgi:Na+-transporting NADH:ubiquinone oxidoreductase subunit NqrB